MRTQRFEVSAGEALGFVACAALALKAFALVVFLIARVLA